MSVHQIQGRREGGDDGVKFPSQGFTRARARRCLSILLTSSKVINRYFRSDGGLPHPIPENLDDVYIFSCRKGSVPCRQHPNYHTRLRPYMHITLPPFPIMAEQFGHCLPIFGKQLQDIFGTYITFLVLCSPHCLKC